MKNIFRFSSLFVVLFGACIAITMVFVGCQNEEIASSEHNQDLQFLDFGANFTNEGILSSEDMDVVLEAIDRAVVTTDDGLMQIAVISASKANVSDRVFRHLQNIIEFSNSMLLTDLEKTRLAPQTRGGDEDYVYWGYDCVPCCIAYISESNNSGTYWNAYMSARII